jgi:hypothetical protein
LTKGQKWKRCSSRKVTGSLFPSSVPSPSIALEIEDCPFQIRKHMHHSWDTECIQFSVNSIVVSYHHKMTMVRCLDDVEIGRQVKCKVCDVGLCIFGCFKKNHTKERFSYMTEGVNPVYTSGR